MSYCWMWQQRKAGLQARLAGAGDDQAIRQAASEGDDPEGQGGRPWRAVGTVQRRSDCSRSRPSTTDLSNSTGQSTRRSKRSGNRLPAEVDANEAPADLRQSQAAALLKSIEQGLKSVEGMRAGVEQRFQNDLAESNKSEIVQLAESNLRSNHRRQRAIFYYYSAMSDNCRCHKSLFFRNLSHFCEFRLELGLCIRIPVKQATFSQLAF